MIELNNELENSQVKSIKFRPIVVIINDNNL